MRQWMAVLLFEVSYAVVAAGLLLIWSLQRSQEKLRLVFSVRHTIPHETGSKAVGGTNP